MRGRWVLGVLVCLGAARGAKIRGSGSGSGSEDNPLAPPPLYPLAPSPADGPPSPNPFAKVDFDTEPVGGSIVVPPPPISSGLGGSGSGGDSGGSDAGSGSGSGSELWGDGLPYEDPPLDVAPMKRLDSPLVHLRKDSFNPYCDVCKLVALTHDIEEGGSGSGGGDACKFATESRKEQCEVMQRLFTNNMDSHLLLMGCIDKTGNVPIRCAQDYHLMSQFYPERKIYPDRCPAAVMCNIIEDESGGPLCGKVLRGWGDFLPEDKGKRASGRPTPWDTYPRALEAPRYAPPPWLGVYPGNPYCDLCVDIMNQKQMNASATPEYACIRQPESLRWKCEEVAKTLLENERAKKVLKEGCVDRTGKEAVEKEAGGCPGRVACNLIEADSGPMCGDMIEQYGDMKGGGEGSGSE